MVNPCLTSCNPDNFHSIFLHAKIILTSSGCDLNAPRRPGPGGRGGEEAKDQAGPLHLCCEWGLESVVQTLIEHGAAINSKVCY